MGQGVFKVGDEVIGFTLNSIHKDDANFDGRVGKITHVYPDGKPPHCRVHYEDGDYWFYNLTDLELAKNYIISKLIDEL